MKLKFGDGFEADVKPCPFCGEDEFIMLDWNYGKHGGFARIKCSACGAQARTISDNNPHYREEAIAAWNRRPL